MEYYRTLGREIERRWEETAFDALALGEIAGEALARSPAREHTSVTELVAHFLESPGSQGLLPQHDVAALFGDPPVTVYTGRGFYIAVNLWRSSTTSIHQHSFAGAFQVLAGSSVHTTYSFRERRRINSHLQLGEIECQGVEILNPGDTRAIPVGLGTAHSLFHLDHPSATVVVRTLSEGEFEPQLAYLPPSVAFDPFHLNRSVDPVLKRRIQLLGFLEDVAEGPFFEHLEGIVNRSDPWTVFNVLSQLVDRLALRAGNITELAAVLERLLAPVRARDPDLGEALAQSLLEAARRSDMEQRRKDIRDPEHRFFWAVMMNSPTREAAFSLIERRYPDKDPLELSFRWIDAMAGTPDPDADRSDGEMSLLGLEPDAVVVLKHLIRSEPSFEELLEILRSEYSAEDLQEAGDGLAALYHELRNLSPWQTFFAHSRG